MGVFEQIIQQAMDAKNRAVQAARQAERERRRRREENDRYVTGGVNWDGYGLEPLIKMVAERASPAQLDALAGEWSRHGQSVAHAADDLRRSTATLMQFWSGTAADEALQKVSNNIAWIQELGGTAQRMAAPVQDASGALRSAQDTMPGVPKNNWLATAGGGAAAGFAVGGPIGAAFGAAIGGLVSIFGFGSKKKKLKRRAVQTMRRYEDALLGVDQSTPQFGLPADGVDPGTGPGANPDPGIGTPGGSAPPPGAISGGPRPGQPVPGPVRWEDWSVTDPSFAGSPEGRWQSLTGLGPNASGAGGVPPGAGNGLGTGGGPNGVPGLLGGTGRGAVGPGGGYGAGRGAGATRGGGAYGRGGAAARGGGGYPGAGMGGAGGRGDRDYRGRGRFGKTGALGGRGGYGMGAAPGGRRDEEEDGEHRRRVPIEDDPFSTDLKAAPPVIGL